MRFPSDLAGTLRNAFKVGRANFDASGVTGERTHSLPDKSGTIALLSDVSAGLSFTEMSKSGAVGPIGFMRTAKGSCYTFLPTWEEAKAVALSRYIGHMNFSGSGTSAGTSAAIGLDYLTLTTGTTATGNVLGSTAEGSQSLQWVARPYPDCPVTNLKSLWSNCVFKMPGALSSSTQRYSIAVGANTSSTDTSGGAILLRYTDNVNGGRPYINYRDASNSLVTVDTTLGGAGGDVIGVSFEITRDSSGVATLTVVVKNITQGTSWTHSATGADLIYNSTDAFPPNISQSKMAITLQKSVGTTAAVVLLYGMVCGFDWITPLSEWQ